MSKTPPREPPLDQLDAWVFDLDNTLYPASSSLFPQIDVRMRQFIAARLDLSPADAYALQKRYYREFGTTLRGLMTVHGMEPDDFLDYVHDIDHSVLDRAPRLDAALANLPGRKLIFTNGSERHAERTLLRLGVEAHFDGIFDIAAARYTPKPQPECYDLMLRRFNIDPRTAAMVEDLQRNLAPAAALGMTTIWVRQDDHPDHQIVMNDHDDLSHIDHITDDLPAWLEGAFPTPLGALT